MTLPFDVISVISRYIQDALACLTTLIVISSIAQYYGSALLVVSQITYHLSILLKALTLQTPSPNLTPYQPNQKMILTHLCHWQHQHP